MSGAVPPSVIEALSLALRLKAEMVEGGEIEATAECPRCGHKVTAALVGPKNHLRLACETPDCIRMLE